MKHNKLLSRDEFRTFVFQRDNHTCVICGKEGKDAHHIIDRKLFNNGGYYLNNGVTLCNNCHIKAETTDITCEAIREAAGIKETILPEDFYPSVKYDKWGNIYMGAKRCKGPLFEEENVQKALKTHLSDFTEYVKYPRTMHLPWSQYKTQDDRVLTDTSHFKGKEVVVTEKMDGENSSLYRDYFHARSLDGNKHWTQAWLKQFHASFQYEIPKGWRFCGENVFAQHSIHYDSLDTYFYLFSIWNDKNECLSWDETVTWAKLLGLQTVPVMYRGIYNEDLIKQLADSIDTKKVEGYVVRITEPFKYFEFKTSAAKFVRRNHVQNNSRHWRTGHIEQNQLKELPNKND